MKRKILEQIDFYLVTDSGLSRKGTCNDVEQALKAGCKIVQYREKHKSTKEMIEEAALNYAAEFSWENQAQRHYELAERILPRMPIRSVPLLPLALDTMVATTVDRV